MDTNDKTIPAGAWGEPTYGDFRSVKSGRDIGLDRIALALESIAESLLKLAKPPLVHAGEPVGSDLKPSHFTYLERFGRAVPEGKTE